ncbi:MAG: CPBP family intramembrane metalloprotease [Flavobacteriales bacterium]|nr:CPBP family intramembrane metalloprotease [Flavobacteriales bacterium]
MNNSKFPSFSSSLIIFIALFAFTIILGIPLMIYSEFYSFFNKDIATSFTYAISMLATIFLTYRIIIKREKSFGIFDSEDSVILNFSLGKAKKYIYIILLAFVMMLWVDFFASLIPMPEWIMKIFEEALNLSIPNIITIAILAPILEEILVRGLVLRGYLKNYSPKKAIILSAVFFGLIHLNPWQFIAGFISGLLLGYIYYKTRSLAPSILIHFINNSLTIVFAIYYPESDASFIELFGDTSYYIILISSLALGYVILNKLNLELNKEYKTSNDKLFDQKI